jgi:NADH-quinone oxidoreductase subunit L
MLINRVGDVCLALGMFVCYYTFKSLDYTVMFALAQYMVDDSILILGMEMNSITVIGILFLLGACGKSAQLGLHG